MMGGKIDCYLDCVSPYSYFAIKYLREQRPLLASYGIDIEFHPIFLGGVNVGTGNKPPWTLPAKAAYGTFDRKRANKYFGVPDRPAPDFFPILSIFPQRCMLYVQRHFSKEKFEQAFVSLWISMWQQHIDVSKPDLLAGVLAPQFSAEEIKDILAAAGQQEYKDLLSANTKKAIELGAYGAPFFSVTNAEGTEEPFFGSDRFHYMFDYLGVPVQHLAIKEKSQL